MLRPLILAVDADARDLASIERALHGRYTGDYTVVCRRSASEALDLLRQLTLISVDVALVIADPRMTDVAPLEFFRETGRIAPHAKRVMLAERSDTAALQAAVAASAAGQVDYRLGKPTGLEPDERFHRQIGELLADWAWMRRAQVEVVKVIATSSSGRAHEIRDALQRNSVPAGFYDAGTAEGQALLRDHGVADAQQGLPVVIVHGRTVLTDPSNRDIAAALGFVAPPPDHIIDLLVVGAGPAGLGAAVYASSEGLETLILEREALGGQAGESSLISNYLGFPGGISGRELVMRACEQALLFGAKFLATRDTVALERDGDAFAVQLDDGGVVRSRVVLVATGVRYRRLDVPSLERLRGAGVYYGSVMSEAPALEGRDAIVVGGGNAAAQAALHLGKYARRVTLVSRGEDLGRSMSQYLVNRLRAAENIVVHLRTTVIDGAGEAQLERVTLSTGASQESVRADGLFVMIGAMPHTEWLPSDIARDGGGYLLTGVDLLTGSRSQQWPLRRPPLPLESSWPGVFAAGDVRHGSLQRVVAAASDGAAAVRDCYSYLTEADGLHRGMVA